MPRRRSEGEPAPRFALADALDLLEASPGRIAGAATAIPADRLHEPLDADGWSARDILAHVRACDLTWGSYIVRILDEDRPSFRAQSPRSTIHATDFLAQPFGDSLDAFAADRARLMGRLRHADEAAFTRAALVTIPSLGAVDRTVRYYVDRLAEHEQEHVEHIERSLATRP